MFFGVIAYTTLPLLPVALDSVKPLHETRPKIFILGGEFGVDREDYYWEIYFFDLIACIVTSVMVGTIDSMYAAVVEQCLGLFAIVTLVIYNEFSADDRKIRLPEDRAHY